MNTYADVTSVVRILGTEIAMERLNDRITRAANQNAIAAVSALYSDFSKA